MTIDILRMQSMAPAASVILKAMANERRLMVLSHIANGEKSVGELERLIGLSQSALSQHLARLRRDGLVRTRRQAQTIYYRVTNPDVMALLETVQRLELAVRGDLQGGAAPSDTGPSRQVA